MSFPFSKPGKIGARVEVLWVSYMGTQEGTIQFPTP